MQNGSPEPSSHGDRIREVVWLLGVLARKGQTSAEGRKGGSGSHSPCLMAQRGSSLRDGLVWHLSCSPCSVPPGASRAKAHLAHTTRFTLPQACPQGRFWRPEFSCFPTLPQSAGHYSWPFVFQTWGQGPKVGPPQRDLLL